MTPVRASTPSSLANIGAEVIRAAFARHRRAFRRSTRRARNSFERRDWARLREEAAERLRLYRREVDSTEREVRGLLGPRVDDKLLWVGLKAVYSRLVAERDDWDLGETFFHSVTRRVFSTVGVDPLVEFVDTDFDARVARRPVRDYGPRRSAAELVKEILLDRDWEVDYEAPAADATAAGARIEAHLAEAGQPTGPLRAEIFEPVLFRGKGAYLVGRLVGTGGLQIPLALSLRNRADGIRLDAVLLREEDVSILFSFTRWYFQADTPRPYDAVSFLKEILPRKRNAEIYISLGLVKHGKTELYRELLEHLETAGERFGLAPGTPGLVMVVFTLPGLDLVLKVIRDRFPPQKRMSPETVRERYRMVHLHDRAGRLVDAQEFELLRFDRSLFDDELLEELLTSCSVRARLDGDDVVIGHAYVERKVVPLNLYVREAPFEQASAAVMEYGGALRDLAACDIFPGDLLLKNFGVTRHGRIAFYDYDELALLEDVVFRDLPEAQYDWQEMSAEPWYSVDPEDVFPEEFRAFLGLPPPLRAVFEQHHGELFTADWWRGVQRRVREGRVMEFPPYPAEMRLQPEG